MCLAVHRNYANGTSSQDNTASGCKQMKALLPLGLVKEVCANSQMMCGTP